MKIGDYVRIDNPGSKSHGKDGRIHRNGYDNCLIVKLLHNSKTIRIKRHKLHLHTYVPYMRRSDGMLGSMPASMNKFTPNIGDVIFPANPNMFVPFFFKIGDRVNIMHNSRGYVGRVTEVSIQHARIKITFISTSGAEMDLWRNMSDVTLSKEKMIEQKIAVSTPVKVEESEYELTVLKTTSTEKQVTIFKSLDAMKSYLDQILNPAIVKSISYREIKKVYGDVKPIKMKVVRTFEL